MQDFLHGKQVTQHADVKSMGLETSNYRYPTTNPLFESIVHSFI